MSRDETLIAILRNRMAAIRANVPRQLETIDTEVTQVRTEIKIATDWRTQFVKHPWLIGGLAFGLGYWLVPRTRKHVVLNDAQVGELTDVLRSQIKLATKAAKTDPAPTNWIQTAATNLATALAGLGGNLAAKSALNWLNSTGFVQRFFPHADLSGQDSQAEPKPVPPNLRPTHYNRLPPHN